MAGAPGVSRPFEKEGTSWAFRRSAASAEGGGSKSATRTRGAVAFELISVCLFILSVNQCGARLAIQVAERWHAPQILFVCSTPANKTTPSFPDLKNCAPLFFPRISPSPPHFSARLAPWRSFSVWHLVAFSSISSRFLLFLSDDVKIIKNVKKKLKN